MANAYAQSNSYSIATALFGTTSPVTGAAPLDADISDGLGTEGLSEITVKVSVPLGVTLSGAGTLLAYEFDPVIGRWFRVPGADLPINGSAVRDLEVGVITVARFTSRQRKPNRVSYVPSGVTFGGGGAGGVTTTLVGTPAVQASTGMGF